MIDTDKYEGHTPGPWILSEEYAYELFVYAGDVRLAKMDGDAPLYLDEHGNPEDLNAQLIADAPLILQALIDERAEVKRLRENLKRIRDTVFYDIEENFTDEQAYDPVLIEIMEKMKAVL